MNQCSIITYHFVRQLMHTRYPKIKGLLVSQFINQLDYLSKNYEFVTMQDCVGSIYSHAPLPNNAVLLTFDDGCIDHFTSVFPILEERGIEGCFFPPVKAILGNEVLDVNKIQFISTTANNIDDLLNDVYSCLDEYRTEYNLKDNKYYFSKLAQEGRFDSKEIIFIKRLLQRELDVQLRKLIVDKLFSKYVTADEPGFSRDLYMNVEQLKCMIRNGMYVGGHGYNHYWLDTLTADQQEKEVDLSLEFLRKVGAEVDNWVMSYPYGACDSSLVSILKRKNCKLGLTTRVGVAKFNKENAFTLERLDTNDLPR